MIQKILLGAALALAHFGSAFAADQLPNEFRGEWCEIDLHAGRALRSIESFERRFTDSHGSNCPDADSIKFGATSYFSEEAGKCQLVSARQEIRKGILGGNPPKVRSVIASYRCVKASNPEFTAEIFIERGKLFVDFDYVAPR